MKSIIDLQKIEANSNVFTVMVLWSGGDGGFMGLMILLMEMDRASGKEGNVLLKCSISVLA